MDPNNVRQSVRAFISNPPAAPGNNATVVLFTTHRRLPGGSGTAVGPSQYVRGDGQVVNLHPDALEEVEITWHKHDQASAANGVRAYMTLDGGATWVETDMKGELNGVANQPSCGAGAPIQVPALTAGQEWAETFRVGRYRGFCVEHTAGATGPTAVTGWLVSAAVTYSPQGEG